MELALVPLRADMWPLAALVVLLVAAAYTDVRSGRIHNVVTYAGVAVGLIGHTLTGGLAGTGPGLGLSRLGLLGALAGLAVGFLPMLVVWRMGGIGGGDAKLTAAVGALTGWNFTLAVMLYGFLVAALMAIGVMIIRGIVRDTLGRIWRFLVLALSKAKPADPATSQSPKIPFGLALCIGGLAHLVDVVVLGGAVSHGLLGAGSTMGY